jgi:hypothetical protein
MLRTINLVACAAIGLLVVLGDRAVAQTPTWNGNGTDWLTNTNWTPNTVPGVAGSTANTNLALFDTAGSTATLNNLGGGFSVGTIATTTTATGGMFTVNSSGSNGVLRVNGGNSIAGFGNTILAAQGRDLLIQPGNMSFAFGTAGQTSTFYADTGRSILLATQQITNSGGNINKEGTGTLVLGYQQPSLTTDFGVSSTTLSVNNGTVAATGSFNNLGNVNVATGATLQAGLTASGTLSVSNATVSFANNSQLKILTDGVNVSQLQNVNATKSPGDMLQVVLSGLNPSGSQTITFSPPKVFVQANTLTGFDPVGSYSPSNPGHFSVLGDGFNVTDWHITVNSNSIQLDGMSVSPVPEPVGILLASGAIFGIGRAVRDRRTGSVA